MLPKDRRTKILNLLKEAKDIGIKEISKELEASIATIYRDLDFLERQGYIVKYYGGFQLAGEDKLVHGFFRRINKNIKQKRSIAKEAVKLINDGETIMIASSSTCFYLSRELKKANLKNITVITDSVIIPSELFVKENITVISVGGRIDRELALFVNSTFENILGNIRCDKHFFSAQAISVDDGIMDLFNSELNIMRKRFFEISKESICLVDSSKFYKSGTVKMFGFDKLNKIITDKSIDQTFVDELKEKGVEVIISN